MDAYAYEATLTRVVPIGLVPEGVRLDAHYTGTITEGPLAGDAVEGVDYLLLRPDGVGVITGQVCGDVPGREPLPWQVSHTASLVRCTDVVTPCAASRNDIA